MNEVGLDYPGTWLALRIAKASSPRSRTGFILPMTWGLETTPYPVLIPGPKSHILSRDPRRYVIYRVGTYSPG